PACGRAAGRPDRLARRARRRLTRCSLHRPRRCAAGAARGSTGAARRRGARAQRGARAAMSTDAQALLGTERDAEADAAPASAEALDAYSRTVAGAAERLSPSVANLR